MKHNNKNSITIFLICLIISLVGCRENDYMNLDEDYGYLQISSIELDKKVITRSSTDSEKLALDILKNDQLIKHVDDWTLLKNENIELPVGQYKLRAYSADKELGQGFDVQPYYEGEASVVIANNKAKTVTITCTLSQSMVSISYSDNFKKAFSQYECIVKNKNGEISFSSTEVRPGYFLSGDTLLAVLNVTNIEGHSFSFSKLITEKAEKRYHYKVKFDITNEGTGSFNLKVDETIREYEINITIPVSTEEVVDPGLQTKSANAWGKFAFMYGSIESGTDNDSVSFMYRKVGEEDWHTVNATLNNSVYEAKTEELDFSTTYEYRIANGDKVGNTETFVTEDFEEIPNLNFDTWTLNGKTWYPNPVANNYEATGAYWATGNEGITSSLAGGHNSITIPVEGNEAYKGKAAKLTTITGITLVKSAAGNLLVGKYKTNMLNPSKSVIFGRPYSGARPVALSGYYKYSPQPISEGTSPGHLTTDECHIYVRLWDSSGNEIGYGEFVGTDAVDTYTKFSFEINYSDPVAKPATLTIVATSSHYGGEFNGFTVVGQVGKESTLWVDEFELSYY